MASTTAAADHEESLKATLWYHIGQYVDEESVNENFNATPQFIGALTELVYNQISNTSRDLEAFAKHGGRSVINTDDVMLLARRNEGLEVFLKRALDDIKAREGRDEPAQKKARGRPVGTGPGKGKGKAKQ